MRTFLALCFSVGATRRLAEAVEREAARLSGSGAKLAWVPPAKLHLTLKFFGDIPSESLDAIVVRLKKRCADLPPLSLHAKGYGAFPIGSLAAPSETGGAPRVLWIGVDGGKPLTQLREAIESDMEDLGFPRELRPFHPHITVARVIEAPTSFAWQSDPDGSDFGADKVPEVTVYETVYESQTKPRSAAEYLARARVPFLKSGFEKVPTKNARE